MKVSANKISDPALFNNQLKSVTDVKSINISRLLEAPRAVCDFVKANIPLYAHGVFVINTKVKLSDIPVTKIQSIIDLKSIHFKDGQCYLQEIHGRLPMSGMYSGCAPIPGSKKRNRQEKHSYECSEILGRLVYAGFSIIEYSIIAAQLFYCVMKTHDPMVGKKSSRRWIISMNRVGLGGDLMKVYKVRTMHPYSEYLQDFVIKLNGYNKVGKPANDFRLTLLGKFFRKYWIDELPQIINILKGDLAIVGVRPLSKTRFNELPEDVRKERVKFKPGCIPPYVSLVMPDNEGNIEAERIYMKQKSKRPYWTDVKFFFLAVYNILTGKIRSA